MQVLATKMTAVQNNAQGGELPDAADPTSSAQLTSLKVEVDAQKKALADVEAAQKKALETDVTIKVRFCYNYREHMQSETLSD